MIRVYSANFTSEDYKNISDIFRHGLEVFCREKIPEAEKPFLPFCEALCPYSKACKAVAKAELYCRRKADENGES